MGKIFAAGVEAGYNYDDTALSESGKEYNPDDYTIIDMAFVPEVKTMLQTTDSIRFANGEKYPMVMTRASVSVPATATGGSIWWLSVVIYIGCMVLFVLFIIQLIKFVVNINKGNIFVKKNATRLHRMAWYLISISLLRIIAGSIDDMIFSNLNLQLDGYSLSTFWTIPWSSLLCGLLALLIAEAWKQGIVMKEEQSLTI